MREIIAGSLVVIWGITYIYFSFRNRKEKPTKKRLDELREIIATAKPYTVPDEKVKQAPPQAVNRAQKRRLEKQMNKAKKKYAGKISRDEIRSGKIIESNEFLKTYFDGKK
jgi:hypothetical protein